MYIFKPSQYIFYYIISASPRSSVGLEQLPSKQWVAGSSPAEEATSVKKIIEEVDLNCFGYYIFLIVLLKTAFKVAS